MKLKIILCLTLAWSIPAFGDGIHEAAKNGDLEKVKALLKDNPDLVFSKDNDGRMPLSWAVLNNHKDVAEFLLANKADPNAFDNYDGSSALDLAVFDGNKEMVQWLFDHGAKANGGDVYAAAEHGHKEVVELLLAHKADVNAKDSSGWTPLFLAANNDHTV
jgi:26S proteasome non-ATPase regulatory subunit 10